MTLLITSVPPNISRFDANGNEFGKAYQLTCIESWKRAGFKPLSVNSKVESFNHSALRTVPVKRDASAVTGRLHIFFADLLAVAVNEAQGKPFALLNADLILRPDTDIAAKVASLRPGEFIFSRRIDIDKPDQTDGVAHRPGFDFFAAHTNDLASPPDSGMVFGAPWWDHYFPLVMFMRGCRIRMIQPTVFHLTHTDRWDWEMWKTLGQRFISEFKALTLDGRYSSMLDNAIRRRTGRTLSDIKYNVWKRLPQNASGEPVRMLHRVSDANVSFLDEISAS